MNNTQKNIIFGVIAIIVLMLLFPPFHLVTRAGTVNVGYSFLFSPPQSVATVDVALLMVQWLGVLNIGALAYYLAGGKAMNPVVEKIQRLKIESPSGSEPLRPDSSEKVKAIGVTMQQHDDTSRISGVGGWLALLVMSLVALGPFYSVVQVATTFVTLEAGESGELLATSPEWRSYKGSVWFIVVLSISASIYAGVGLMKKKEWVAVQQTIAILWLTNPGSVIVIGVLLPTLIFVQPTIDTGELIRPFIGSTITASVWTAYLLKSKRVRNTYLS